MLFDGYRHGGLALANRAVMAPLTRCRASHVDAVPNELMLTYYRQRASAGLIISEGVPVSDRARGYQNTGALYTEAQALGWKRVVEAVHEAGGKMAAQLWHCGRISHSALHADGSKPVAPSSLTANCNVGFIGPYGHRFSAPCEQPEALDLEGIKGVVAEFAESARLARLAGFDAIEIHGANGYLLDQFRCPLINDRTDDYGGSTAKRYRLLLEVVDAVCVHYEPGRVIVRQSPLGVNNDMQPDPYPDETYPWLAAELQAREIGFLHLFDQSFSWIHHADDELLPAIRAAFKGGLIACGGFDSVEKIEAVLARGADLVAIGRPFIANPDLVHRLRKGIPLQHWDISTFYAGGARGYTDYPTATT